MNAVQMVSLSCAAAGHRAKATALMKIAARIQTGPIPPFSVALLLPFYFLLLPYAHLCDMRKAQCVARQSLAAILF
jgi:hypothetical protein